MVTVVLYRKENVKICEVQDFKNFDKKVTDLRSDVRELIFLHLRLPILKG